MRHSFFAAAIAVASVVGLGCANNKDEAAASGSKPMSADACAMCAGHQKATASNTCPKCNMSLEKMKPGAMHEKSSAAPGGGGDACEACPGVQTTAVIDACAACAGKPM